MTATEKRVSSQELTQEEKNAIKAAKREKRRIRRAISAKKQADHLSLVPSAVRTTIAALATHGISCAAFGSLACKLYGRFREPKDVDLLIIEPHNPNTPPRTAEEIKALIIDTAPRHFFLKMPRDPEVPYRILNYGHEYLEAHCKVDVLVPATMYLPDLWQPSHSILPSITSSVPLASTSAVYATTNIVSTIQITLHNRITTISGIPLVPFFLLLLYKLQGWADHRVAPGQHKRREQVQDAADVQRLMAMTMRMKELQRTRPWTELDLSCEELQQLTRERVKDY